MTRIQAYTCDGFSTVRSLKKLLGQGKPKLRVLKKPYLYLGNATFILKIRTSNAFLTKVGNDKPKLLAKPP